MISDETSFQEIPWVFIELSLIIHKISCPIFERHENRRFFENKRLFLNQRNIFLWFTCKVTRMLSNGTSFEGLSWAFNELSAMIAKVSQARDTKIEVSLRIKDYFSTKHTCICSLLLELNECDLMTLTLNEYLVFSKSYHW